MKILLSWKKEEILDKKDIRCIIVGGAKLVLPIYYITLRKRIMKYLKQFLLILCITFCWRTCQICSAAANSGKYLRYGDFICGFDDGTY